MNPLTNVKNLAKLNERELALGFAGQDGKSWHQKYKESAWIFVGGIPYELTEGDIITVFSQYGEIVNINLLRDRKTGKSRGFGFVCYEDQRSTILAVDNFNGIKLLGRTLRVDHVEEYRVPKLHDDIDEATRKVWEEGCAPKPIEVPHADDNQLLPLELPLPEAEERKPEKKKKKKDKKKKEKHKEKHRRTSDQASSHEHHVHKTDRSDFSSKQRNLTSADRIKQERSSTEKEVKKEHSRSATQDYREKNRAESKRFQNFNRNESVSQSSSTKKIRMDDAYVPKRYTR